MFQSQLAHPSTGFLVVQSVRYLIYHTSCIESVRLDHCGVSWGGREVVVLDSRGFEVVVLMDVSTMTKLEFDMGMTSL